MEVFKDGTDNHISSERRQWPGETPCQQYEAVGIEAIYRVVVGSDALFESATDEFPSL